MFTVKLYFSIMLYRGALNSIRFEWKKQTRYHVPKPCIQQVNIGLHFLNSYEERPVVDTRHGKYLNHVGCTKKYGQD